MNTEVFEMHKDMKFIKGYRHLLELAIEHYDEDIMEHPLEWYEQRRGECDEILEEIERRLADDTS